jgi:hypothetical protein
VSVGLGVEMSVDERRASRRQWASMTVNRQRASMSVTSVKSLTRGAWQYRGDEEARDATRRTRRDRLAKPRPATLVCTRKRGLARVAAESPD